MEDATRVMNKPLKESWHEMTAEEVVARLSTNPTSGLDETEARNRLGRFGPNELPETGVRGVWEILKTQLTSVMVLILLAAVVVSGIVGDFKDMIVILIIVVLNAALGFQQEYKAEKAMSALKKLATPVVRVCREGKWKEIRSRELVPGDVLAVEAGNHIPADARVVESHSLRTQEATLTGESQAVEKQTDPVSGLHLPVADRKNMVYMGTIVVYGRGSAIVVSTGSGTELGRISELIQEMKQEATPLQRRMDQLGGKLALIAIALVMLILALGLLRGEPLKLMFLTAVSLAVAAVPEGLPAVVTIALAIGAQRMLKSKALIRKLPAVEALGSVTVICSDKTGTLTENRMSVAAIETEHQRIESVASLMNGQSWEHSVEPSVFMLLAGGALCNDAIPQSDSNNGMDYLGDPTEIAFVESAQNFGMDKGKLEEIFHRVEEVPFTSERKRMSTLHETPSLQQEAGSTYQSLLELIPTNGGSHIVFMKGAVDGLLENSAFLLKKDGPAPIEESDKQAILSRQDELAQKGMRLLGVAFRQFDWSGLTSRIETELEEEMVFVGMAGLIDPPRTEARDAVATCKSAGIRPIMITGDHPLTAQEIARQLSIDDGKGTISGTRLAAISESELDNVVEQSSVFARVSPEHKLNIVNALQKKGEIVAMTGDGINDAPALKKADIGVAMGITGTDVAKESSDMVLLDDNFATIVSAVREGRIIYDNIRKFVRYILGTNSGELWVMLLASLAGMPLALLPLQILWLNLVTDGLPALALSVEPAERNVMTRQPYHPRENVFSRGLGIHVIWVGLMMGMMCIITGYVYWSRQDPAWQTMVFTLMTILQMAHVMAIRSERDSLFRIGLLSNLPLLLAVMLTAGLQFVIVYVPFFQSIFDTEPLTTMDHMIVLTLSLILFSSVEVEKWFRHRRTSRETQRKASE